MAMKSESGKQRGERGFSGASNLERFSGRNDVGRLQEGVAASGQGRARQAVRAGQGRRDAQDKRVNEADGRYGPSEPQAPAQQLGG